MRMVTMKSVMSIDENDHYEKHDVVLPEWPELSPSVNTISLYMFIPATGLVNAVFV